MVHTRSTGIRFNGLLLSGVCLLGVLRLSSVPPTPAVFFCLHARGVMDTVFRWITLAILPRLSHLHTLQTRVSHKCCRVNMLILVKQAETDDATRPFSLHTNVFALFAFNSPQAYFRRSGAPRSTCGQTLSRQDFRRSWPKHRWERNNCTCRIS